MIKRLMLLTFKKIENGEIINAYFCAGQYCTFYMNPLNVPFLKKVIHRFQEKGEYVGRYDPFAWLKNDLFLGIRMGICVPSKCTAKEIQYMANESKWHPHSNNILLGNMHET